MSTAEHFELLPGEVVDIAVRVPRNAEYGWQRRVANARHMQAALVPVRLMEALKNSEDVVIYVRSTDEKVPGEVITLCKPRSIADQDRAFYDWPDNALAISGWRREFLRA